MSAAEVRTSIAQQAKEGKAFVEESQLLRRGGISVAHAADELLLYQRDLRSELQVNQHGDAAIQLKEGSGFSCGQCSAEDRLVLLPKLCDGHIQI